MLVFGAKFDFRDEIGGQKIGKFASNCGGARNSEQIFQLRIPRFHHAVMCHCENAHVQRFHNVFAEVFEALDLNRFLLERAIQLRVIESDGDVTGDRKKKLNVFAGKKIAVNRFAEPQNGDGAFADAARNVVIQIQLLNGWRVDAEVSSVFRGDS